jgi:hypothetical protein
MFRSITLAGLSLLVSSTIQAQASLQHIQLSVNAADPIWTPTGITVTPGDLLHIQAEGMVTIGPHHPKVNPDGAPSLLNAGALEFKITVHSAHLVGTAGCFIADQNGEVMVRVHDRRYEDNAGTYTVRILHVPAQTMPAPRIVDR